MKEVFGWKSSCSEESNNSFHNVPMFSFSPAIFFKGVMTRLMMQNLFGTKIGMKFFTSIFTPTISLECLNRSSKLSLNISKKMSKSRETI